MGIPSPRVFMVTGSQHWSLGVPSAIVRANPQTVDCALTGRKGSDRPTEKSGGR